MDLEGIVKGLTLMIAKSLVDKPDEVDLQEVIGEKTTVLELRVAKEDLGEVIGKQRKSTRAMRTILNATATKVKKWAVLEIIESYGLDFVWQGWSHPWSERRVEVFPE